MKGVLAIVCMGALAAFIVLLNHSDCTEENQRNFSGNFGHLNSQFRNFDEKNLSPYALFGDSSHVLMTEAERLGSYLLVVHLNHDSLYSRVEIQLKTGKVRAYDRFNKMLEDFILPSEVLAKFIQVDPRKEKYSGWSPYNFVMNSPILNIDPDGDTVKTSQEGYGLISDGLTGTLGINHPFGFDVPTGTVTFNSSFDRSKYTVTQLDVIDRMSSVVTNAKTNETRVVNYNEVIPELGGSSLKDYGFNGGTTPDGQLTWIARNPQIVGTVVNPNYNPQNLLSKEYIPGLVNAPNYFCGISALHEIGGHANLRFTDPSLSQADHNLNVENFETSFRQVYQIGTYKKKGDVKRANKNGANVKVGDPKYLKGNSDKH